MQLNLQPDVSVAVDLHKFKLAEIMPACGLHHNSRMERLAAV